MTIYVTDPSASGEINEAYRAHFSAGAPARVMVGVSWLPLGALVEIDAVAYIAQKVGSSGAHMQVGEEM